MWESGEFEVTYDDGDTERRVQPEHVRLVGDAAGSTAGLVKKVRKAKKVQGPQGPYAVGDVVEARFRGRAKWFRGKIGAVSRTFSAITYTIEYDDGDTERGLAAEFVRLLNRSEEPVSGGPEKVSAASL